MKKLGSFAIMAGLMALIPTCKNESPQIRLLATRTITDFPSASAIEYEAGRLYVFGDDAPYLLVLDTLFQVLEKTKFSSDTSYRIAKAIKPDIEAVTIAPGLGGKQLVAFGSWSAAPRKSIYRFPLAAINTFTTEQYSLPQLAEIKEWNIEGAAYFQNGFLLTNRANTTTQVNHILLLQNSTDGSVPRKVTAIKAVLPSSTKTIGLSGLFYDEVTDRLLFTASEEDTPNAMEDGTIGASYLGWITQFSKKVKSQELSPQGWINLSAANAVFRGQKIESLCVAARNENELHLFLASDNDNGESRIFKIALVTAHAAQ